MGLDEDHLSIAKPRESDAQVCGAARDLLQRCVLRPPPAAAAANMRPSVAAIAHGALPQELVIKLEPPRTTGSADPPRIPREIPPAAHRFFGREAERKQLAKRLRAGLNTAVVGPAGLGKTALAAAALSEVVGANPQDLAGSPFPDGLVFLDLYAFHGQAEPAWNALANRLRGVEFLERRPARERATEACRARGVLVTVEGGEEADGGSGRTTIPELLGVLSPESRWLLLTRLSTQAAVAESVYVKEALDGPDARALLDSLTSSRPLANDVREAVLELLVGHPLALNWAGNLLAREEEDPADLARDWKSSGLPLLSDPARAERTLHWLFERSVRGLDHPAQQALAAAGLLASAPFSLEAIAAAVGEKGADRGSCVVEPLKKLVQRGVLRRADAGHWQFTHVLGYRFARDEDASDSGLRQRLGEWLCAQVLAGLEDSDALKGATSLGRTLEHSAALLRADYDQKLWQPLASTLLYEASDRLEEKGRLDLVSLALGAVSTWLTRFRAERGSDPGSGT